MEILNVTVKEPCIIWLGPKNAGGYGMRSGIKKFGTDGVHRQIMIMVHGKGAVRGKVVMHLCDNRACYRYSHLQIGSQAENIADMVSKNRHSKKLTAEDLKIMLKLRKTHTLQEIADKYNISVAGAFKALKRSKEVKIHAGTLSTDCEGQAEVH